MKGLWKHRMYPCWSNMVARCTNPKHKGWPNYGGRGITVCEQWLPPASSGFVQWLKDMVDPYPSIFSGDPYSSDYLKLRVSLDREKEAGGYNPENCRWASDEIQQLNRRSAFAGRNLPQGVRWRTAKNVWQAYYTEGKKNVNLGTYHTLLDAVAARRSWELGRFELLQRRLDEKIRGLGRHSNFQGPGRHS